MTHVLIAVDDSENSQRAAIAAHSLFGGDARYTLVCVADVSPSWGAEAMAYGAVYPLALAPGTNPLPFVVGPRQTSIADDIPSPSQAAEQTAADVGRESDLVGANAVGDVGDPAATIVETARRAGADVIVVGQTTRGWFSRLLTPSVASSVVRDAAVPVLVAR